MDAAAASYPDSVDSSPRSRGGDSWDDLFPSSAAPAKLRFMCSFGGQIVPRPHDRSLCYLGGETRIVVVDRHTTLADLSARLSRSLLAGRPFTLKYQLPSEDLDSLISVTTDEDLDNMIEEYDRILSSSSHGGGNGSNGGSSATGASAKPPRLRLFLFPLKMDSPAAGSIGSLVDESKTETWFVDALNSAIGMGGVLPRRLSEDSAASSVNCLIGIDEEKNNPTSGTAAAAANPAAPGEQRESFDHHHQMRMPHADSIGKLDASSSFGSTSSAPSPSNLPPIRVRPDDRVVDQRLSGGGLDEHFSQMNISGQKPEEAFIDGNYGKQYQQQYPPTTTTMINPDPYPAATVTASTIPSTENPNYGSRAFSDDEKSDLGGIGRMAQLQQQHHQQQQKPNTYDAPVSERPVHYQERISPGPTGLSPASDARPGGQYQAPESNYRVQMQVPEQGYMLPMQNPEQLLHPQQQQFHHQQQQLQHQQQQQLQHQQQQQLQQQQLQQQQQQLQQQQQQQLQQQQQQQLQQQQQQLQQQQQQQLQQQQQQQLQQQQQPYVLPPNSHLVHHHTSVPVAPMQPYYQMHQSIPTQQPIPQAHPYSQQVPMYYMPVRPPPNAPYALPAQQPNLADATAPFSSSAKPAALPIPQVIAPPKPEAAAAAANIYRTSAAAPAAIANAPPPSAPQLIHLHDQSHQFMGYHATIHHQPPQPPAAAANYSYEQQQQQQQQPMYYTQASSPAPPPLQYQPMSSVAVAVPDVHPQLQQVDAKQNRASQ